MGVAQDRAKLAQVKHGLADKYANLARVVKSRPRSDKWKRLSAKFRRQAEDLERLTKE
jgi:hypothetical protein